MPADISLFDGFHAVWQWTLLGAWLGLALENVSLALPTWVLARYGDQVKPEDWHGPGGGLFLKPNHFRRVFFVCINACIWTACALFSPPAAKGLTPGILAWALCASSLLVLAVVDWNTTLLPDVLVLTLVWSGLLASERQWTDVTLAQSLWSIVVWYLSMQALAGVFGWVTGKVGAGAGDAKLLAAMAAWWGWQPVLWALLTGAVLTVLAGMIWRLRGLQPWAYVPFGPFLVFGMLGWTALSWGASWP